MVVEPHTKVEQERDLQVQTLPCPTCAAPAGKACRWGVKRRELVTSYTSHTSRYDAAVGAGLVPPLPGVRVG